MCLFSLRLMNRNAKVLSLIDGTLHWFKKQQQKKQQSRNGFSNLVNENIVSAKNLKKR